VARAPTLAAIVRAATRRVNADPLVAIRVLSRPPCRAEGVLSCVRVLTLPLEQPIMASLEQGL